MESTTPKLPQEIINAVVADYAVQNDSRALRKLGLVSRAWSHPTREHLFRAITIEILSFPNLQEKLYELELLLQEKPILGHYIKSLTMNVGSACRLTYRDPYYSEDTEAHQLFMWMDCRIEFPSLLNSLTHVSVGVWERESFHSPRYLPHSFQRALQALFARPHVTSISLDEIEIDVIPLTQHPHIQKLSLHCVSIPAWSRACCFPMNRGPSTSPSSGLLSLDLSLVDAPTWRVLTLCCASPEATLSLGNIKNLTVTTGESTPAFEPITNEQWEAIFNTYGRNVESYTLLQKSYRGLSLDFMPLWNCHNLNQVSLEIWDENPFSDGAQNMPALVKALEKRSQLGEPNDIGSIHVKYLACAQFLKIEISKNQDGNSVWARLGGILEGHTFSSLKEVIFQVEMRCCTSYPTSIGGDWNAFADMCRTQYFPKLSRRGMLTLSLV